MESNIVELRQLYTYAKNHPSGEALHGKSQAGREYGQLGRGGLGYFLLLNRHQIDRLNRQQLNKP